MPEIQPNKLSDLTAQAAGLLKKAQAGKAVEKKVPKTGAVAEDLKNVPKVDLSGEPPKDITSFTSGGARDGIDFAPTHPDIPTLALNYPNQDVIHKAPYPTGKVPTDIVKTRTDATKDVTVLPDKPISPEEMEKYRSFLGVPGSDKNPLLNDQPKPALPPEVLKAIKKIFPDGAKPVKAETVFPGMPGAGKTQLSSAAAEELGKPLTQVKSETGIEEAAAKARADKSAKPPVIVSADDFNAQNSLPPEKLQAFLESFEEEPIKDLKVEDINTSIAPKAETPTPTPKQVATKIVDGLKSGEYNIAKVLNLPPKNPAIERPTKEALQALHPGTPVPPEEPPIVL